MSHIHWVGRQNNLEIPRDKDEVNKREIHERDGRVHDPDKMVSPQSTDTQTDTHNRSPRQRTDLLGERGTALLLLLFIIKR